MDKISCHIDHHSGLLQLLVDLLCIQHIFPCADPEGGGGGAGGLDPPSLENRKYVGFLSNTGLDPLKNHTATKSAFNVGPSSACQRNAI